MNVRIKYCSPCGYRTCAERLAERLRAERGVDDVELVAGNFGVFKIWVDGELAFDKRRFGGWLGRLGLGPLPPDDEILSLVASKKA